MTLIRQLKGFVNGDILRKKPITVHFTSDKYGETISFGHGNTMFTMPYKPIEQMVERERSMNYKDSHFIIDATEEYIPVEWLKAYQDKAREKMNGEYSVDQVIHWIVADWCRYRNEKRKAGETDGKAKPNN